MLTSGCQIIPGFLAVERTVAIVAREGYDQLFKNKTLDVLIDAFKTSLAN